MSDFPLRCRVFGHRCRYVRAEKVEIKAECVRRWCPYEAQITEDGVMRDD